MGALVNQHNIHAGEISRRLWNNTSRQRRASSVAVLENFLPGQFGGATRRPGMEHIDVFPGCRRIIRFQYSETTKFRLAFGDKVMRIYGNGVVVEDPDSPGDPLEIETPWTSADVGGLRAFQVLDTVWICHPDYMPRVLFRRGDKDWVLGTFAPSYPPLNPANASATTITPSATTGEITITASEALFDESHVGSYWKIGHNRSGNNVSFNVTTTGQSSGLLVEGDFTVSTVGDWTASVAVEASLDGGSTWTTLNDWTGANDRQVAWVGTADFPTLLRVACRAFTSATAARIMLDAASPDVYGLVKITEVDPDDDGLIATADVIETLHGTSATDKWAEGAWSDYQGYPRLVKLIDGRLTFVSTYGMPLAYWSSEVDDFADFRRSASNPAASQFRRFYSTTQDGIFWVEQRDNGVIFGSAGDEWQITGFGTTAEEVKRVGYHGSANVPAVTLNDSLVFVQTGGQIIRDYVGISTAYAMARDPNVAVNLTGDAEHITASGVQELCVVQSPMGIIYGLSQGNLFSLTYDRDAGVMGWARHETDGYIHSMCSTSGDYGDEMWFVVTRNETDRIERFHPETETLAYAGSFERCLFLDGGIVSYSATPTTTVTGLDHWEGETVDVLRDGWPETGYVVSGGAITLPEASTWVAVGKSYTSTVETLPIVYQTQSGETRYLQGRVNGIIVDVHNTFGLEYADASANEWYELQRPGDADDPVNPPALQSEPIAAPLDGKHGRQCRCKLRMTKPIPATILGIATAFSSTER